MFLPNVVLTVNIDIRELGMFLSPFILPPSWLQFPHSIFAFWLHYTIFSSSFPALPHICQAGKEMVDAQLSTSPTSTSAHVLLSVQ